MSDTEDMEEHEEEGGDGDVEEFGDFLDELRGFARERQQLTWDVEPSSVDILDLVSKHVSKYTRFLPSIRGLKVLGERGSGLRPHGTVQDFYALRDQCMQEGRLFEDPDFPCTDKSIFFSRKPQKAFVWRRPHEIIHDPRLFYEGASRFDVKQGDLGDCWLLAAVANLTLNPTLLHRVAPEDQNFQELYAGIFHFRFWQYARWIDVVIDDRLPTYNGKLVFMHSASKQEFWSALLEKAYAKLFGSYEALKGGTTMEAMEDFTGGVTEMYELEKAPTNLFKIVLKAAERDSLMGCSLEPDPNITEAETPEGLIKGHAYSVTRVKMVDISTPRVSGKIPLIRLRNPWGNEAEWKGPWSDGSQEWQFISEDEKEALGLTFDDDGEFWMSWKDFLTRFTRMEICNLSPDSLEGEDGEGRFKWEMSLFEAAWIKGATAGGCRNFLETFAHNPQYRIELDDPDEDDEDDKCTVIIALMQKNRRAQRKLGVDCLAVGFAIYHLRDPDRLPKPLDMNFFKYNSCVGRTPTFINLREVSCRFKLPPGTYCIVPSTFDPNEEGEFIIRVFSEKGSHMQENDESLGVGNVDDTVNEVTPQEEEHEEKIRQFYVTIAGEDGEIDWRELKQILDYALKKDEDGDGILEFQFEGFSKDVCRSMIAMLDSDRSGKLGLEEFKTLWMDIRKWKNVFSQFDHDKSGHLNSFELRAALNHAGYRLNNHVLNALVLRYGNREGHLSFDDFIMCAVKLKTMIELFQERDPLRTNKAVFTLDEWVERTLYS